METKWFTESPESRIEDLDRENLTELSRLQRLVCELLSNNQRLRMKLIAESIPSDADNGSASFEEVRRCCLSTPPRVLDGQRGPAPFQRAWRGCAADSNSVARKHSLCWRDIGEGQRNARERRSLHSLALYRDRIRQGKCSGSANNKSQP
jgi:hypothetical protein